jgi:hypothetical protein
MTLCILTLILSSSIAYGGQEGKIILGEWSIPELDAIIKQGAQIKDRSERTLFLSEQFLGTPYMGGTMVGDNSNSEILVINLAAMDCLTYLDNIEAMRRSDSFNTFKENIKKVRYKGGVVAYNTRRHFFTDWIEPGVIQDVTDQLGVDKVKEAVKELNQKEDGTFYLPGLPVKKRTVLYIPSMAISDKLLEALMTGDYVGIYSDLPGLDVSHTGIIFKKSGRVYLRHASSKKMSQKVVDEDLKAYMKNKPGLVVLRPL